VRASATHPFRQPVSPEYAALHSHPASRALLRAWRKAARAWAAAWQWVRATSLSSIGRMGGSVWPSFGGVVAALQEHVQEAMDDVTYRV
jgi:hypothetical protein